VTAIFPFVEQGGGVSALDRDASVWARCTTRSCGKWRKGLDKLLLKRNKIATGRAPRIHGTQSVLAVTPARLLER